MGKRRTCSEEFKKEAVELSYNSDKICKEIIEDLDISYNNLIKWRKEYKVNESNETQNNLEKEI